MHISEGVLSVPVLATSAAIAAAGVGLGLREIRDERIPKVALLSSAFFVASLIHVPIGPSSVHLILNGLLGVLLGWAAFPAILLGLFLQGILFQFGGLTTLGVNTVNMALPAVICFYLFGGSVRRSSTLLSSISGFLTGAMAVFISGIFVAISLALTGEYFINAAKLVLVTHIPVMIIEGIITGFVLLFLKRVKPEMLEV
jgi:cobalt/nickel transport system permease protein